MLMMMREDVMLMMMQPDVILMMVSQDVMLPDDDVPWRMMMLI